jgi:hypothetical protein
MPHSKIKPEDTYSAFHTKEGIRSISKRLGVARETIKRWWKNHFGIEAYIARVTREDVSIEERICRRRLRQAEYKRKNPDKIKLNKCRYYQNNKEKILSKQKLHYSKNSDKRTNYNRTYYKRNAEQWRCYATQYRAENKTLINAKIRNYYTQNPAHLLVTLAKQRAKRMGLPFELTLEYVKQLIPEVCPITLLPFERGKKKPVPQSMTLDKIIPALGYIPGNVMVVSRLANTIKQNCIDPEVFDRLADYIEKGCFI